MKHSLILLISSFLLLLGACSKEQPEFTEIDPDSVTRTVLIYAANNSSLSSDFVDDSDEILKAAEQLDLSRFRILVFRTDDEQNCGLYAVNHSNRTDAPEFSLLRRYPRNTTSTNPDRIAEVIDYALSLYSNSEYDLIFWGHGMSWKPYFTDHTVKIDTPEVHAYGGEYTGGTNPNGYKETDWTEIDELAAAVPDGRFDTIWFDCCYMSGIETIYEFRNKCRTFVGYPTEVWAYGLAYDIVLPYLLSDCHDVVGASRAFFDSYNSVGEPVTVAVVDMSEIENLADAARRVIANSSKLPRTSSLVDYSTYYSAPFYDFGQYVGQMASLNGLEEERAAFAQALSLLVIYHDESAKNFNGKFWTSDDLCGISTHYYRGTDTVDESYYRTLAWFTRVYPQN